MYVASKRVQTDADPLSPVLKWAGGKRWLLEDMRALWSGNRRRIVEPFAGGLAVTLGLAPQRALANDVNPHLVNFYRWLQRGLDVAAAGAIMRNDRAVYLNNRERFNALIAAGKADTAEAAVLFYVLNRTGYNGLCRFSKRGFFNVPFGRYVNPTFREDFEVYRAAFAKYEFRCGDFELLELSRSDFVYADPPYDAVFTEYSAGGFDWDDQVRLARWLAKHRGPVVASNQATPRIIRLYRSVGFSVRKIRAPRRISCTGDRSEALEILAVKGL